MKTLQQVKAEGWTVEVQHVRKTTKGRLIPSWEARKKKIPVSATGGITLVSMTRAPELKGEIVTLDNGGAIVSQRPVAGFTVHGYASVHPTDNFNARKGVQIAIERALASIKHE